MMNLYDIVAQETIEHKFNKRLINNKIKQFVIDNCYTFVEKGVNHVQTWLNKSYYDSKNKRLKVIKELDLYELVEKILIGTVYYQREELFTSVSAQLAGVLGWDDKPDAIKTMAELLAVLCHTDAFDMARNEANSWVLISRIKPTDELKDFIENVMYLPPMVVEPEKVTSNSDTGYLTFKSSLMLGRGNHHDGDLCLDAINIANSVGLRLDTNFLSKVEMPCTFEVKTQQQQDQWSHFKRMTYKIMLLLAKNNNKFWLTHRVDKRGRIYSMGYHVSTQSNAFGKASIEFANEESIDVPAQYRL
jgi:hypothetical protein